MLFLKYIKISQSIIVKRDVLSSISSHTSLDLADTVRRYVASNVVPQVFIADCSAICAFMRVVAGLTIRPVVVAVTGQQSAVLPLPVSLGL